MCLRVEFKGCKHTNGTEIIIFSRYQGEYVAESVEPLGGEGGGGEPSLAMAGSEDWSESLFLAVAVAIMVVVFLVTVAAIAFVLASNRRLKHYSAFYAQNNIDTSSVESSLKR